MRYETMLGTDLIARPACSPTDCSNVCYLACFSECPDSKAPRGEPEQALVTTCTHCSLFICSEKYTASAQAGHADLTVLKSRTLSSWALLNRGTH